MRLSIIGLLLMAGCGDSTTTDGSVVRDLSGIRDLTMQQQQPDATTTGGADMTGTASGDMAMTDDGGAAMVTLKLEDYLSWCKVAVNNGTAATTSVQMLQFAPGTKVDLSGTKASDVFVFGYWVGTAGDINAMHDTMAMTSVTMDSDKTVQACCPFANAPNVPCPAPN